jgi:hypothetical protein
VSDYKDPIGSAGIPFDDGSEGRVERHFRKGIGQETIRYSWWKNGKFVPRPFDTTEENWLEIMEAGIKGGLYSRDYLMRLRKLLDDQPPD